MIGNFHALCLYARIMWQITDSSLDSKTHNICTVFFASISKETKCQSYWCKTVKQDNGQRDFWRLVTILN